MFTLAKRNEILRAKAGVSDRTVRARIEKAYLAATPEMIEQGRAWYPIAKDHCEEIAARFTAPIENVAAVMAQLSPRTQWARNIQGTYDLYALGTAPGHIGANVERARTAMASSDPLASVKGPKTNAFARNILGCPETVTVDVWALRIALGSNTPDIEKIVGRVGIYQAISECYQLVAQKHNETPADMQAITWIVERNGRHA